MLKYILIVFSVLITLAFTASLGDSLYSDDVEIPAFVQTLRELHRGPPPGQVGTTRANVETRWISQKLDNFNVSNEEVWYDVSFFKHFVKDNGPEQLILFQLTGLH